MKKFHIIHMAICIIILGVITVSAATVYVNDFFKYTVESRSVTIVRYYGQDTEVTVPSAIAGNPVNTIAAGAFSACANVTKIALPATIMTIEEGAFGPGQSVVYLEDSSDKNDESTQNGADDTSSADSASVVDDLHESSNQEDEQMTATHGEQTEDSSAADVQQPSNGVDEQEAAFGFEKESEQNSQPYESGSNAEKQTPNYIWLLVAAVLCITMIGGFIYVIARKKRG